MPRTIVALALAAAMAIAESAEAQMPRRRALLVGIDDYSASRITRAGAPESRGWPALRGAVQDVALVRELLIARYSFAEDDIATLTDQEATREAILDAIETHLVRPSRRGDLVFYYFAGHGSQVLNSRSDEPDRLDETIVPADSRAGAPDIRDKELRPLFNRILDRGARLTLLLDHCHGASGHRGAPGARGIPPSFRDAADAAGYGPRPEERGALVMAATQENDEAWEIRDASGAFHGAFTWAWLRAMREALPDDSGDDVFARARMHLRRERPFQRPVLAGTVDARMRPPLGAPVGFLRAGPHLFGGIVSSGS